MSLDRYQFVKTAAKSKASSAIYDIKLVVKEVAKSQKDWKSLIPESDAPLKESIMTLANRLAVKAEAGQTLWYAPSPLTRSGIVLIDEKADTFKTLSLAKDLVGEIKKAKASSILLSLETKTKESTATFLDAFVSALKTAEFQNPRYGAAPKEAPFVFAPKLDVNSSDATHEDVLSRAIAESEGTNLVRELAMLAGNDLTPTAYVARLKKEATKAGLSFEFWDYKKLEKLKAGAFLAVAQASPLLDAGIVKLTYTPKKAKKDAKKICFVGKGITYDTGGTNLKPAQYMFGMHRDMAGSAVAYALTLLAAREQWDVPVTTFLAISDNLTGPKAYRPNDVITAANGKTIEIVHTDAEGRMLLADTLYFASKEKPDIIVDFATLTGACVAAIGNNYSGAFTNRDELHATIIQAGKESGERVWPFPMDEDYGECLKSDIADTKQCRLTGGVDHIEAAYFLKSFLENDVPWVHVDLASADRSGGLGHVDSEVTGFGVRFASRLIRLIKTQRNG